MSPQGSAQPRLVREPACTTPLPLLLSSADYVQHGCCLFLYLLAFFFFKLLVFHSQSVSSTRTGMCCVSNTWSSAWFKHSVNESWGFPGGSVLKNLPANAGDMGPILGGEDPLEKEMATHSSILA